MQELEKYKKNYEPLKIAVEDLKKEDNKTALEMKFLEEEKSKTLKFSLKTIIKYL